MKQIKTIVRVDFTNGTSIKAEFDSVTDRGMWITYRGTSVEDVKNLFRQSLNLKQLTGGLFCYLDKNKIESWDVLDVIEV